MTDIRALLETLTKLTEEAEIAATRRVMASGNITNFNIDEDEPFKLFTGLRGGGEMYSEDDIVKVHYRDEERLQAFLNGRGRRAQEVDEDGNPIEDSSEFNTETVAVQPTTDGKFQVVDADGKLMQGGFDSRDEAAEYAESQSSGAVTFATEPQEPADSSTSSDAPQTDDELDADSADNAASDGQVELSDGSSFNANNERSRTLAAQRAGELLDRYRELMRKMNESAPTSIRGYLKEYNLLEAFLVEALTDAERSQLADVISDLRTLINAEGLLSSQNQELFRREIADAPDLAELRASSAAAGSDAESPDDADSADSGTPDAPPEADDVSDETGDQDATVDPGEGATAGSLEAFASSGKGGLANDADETAAIEELQQFLTDNGFDPNGVDGKYGRGTIAAVRRFQEVFGATVDGDAGPETIGKIVEFRNDMAEMDELISAGGSEESTAGPDDGTRESVEFDFRKFINLVEGVLTEALTDQQKTRAEELIAKYEELVDNLPDPAKGQVQQRIDSLQGLIDAPSDEEPEAEEPEAEEPEAGEAAYKVVTGSGQGRRYTVYDADGNEIRSGRGPGPANLPTQEEWEAQQGDADSAPGEFTVREKRGGQGGNRLFGYEVISPEGEVVETFGRNERAEAEAEAARLNAERSAEEPQDDAEGEEPQDDAEGEETDTDTDDDAEGSETADGDTSDTAATNPVDRFPAQVNDETTATTAIDILRNDAGLLADVLEELSPEEQLLLQRLIRN